MSILLLHKDRDPTKPEKQRRWVRTCVPVVWMMAPFEDGPHMDLALPWTKTLLTHGATWQVIESPLLRQCNGDWSSILEKALAKHKVDHVADLEHLFRNLGRSQ